MTYDDENF